MFLMCRSKHKVAGAQGIGIIVVRRRIYAYTHSFSLRTGNQIVSLVDLLAIYVLRIRMMMASLLLAADRPCSFLECTHIALVLHNFALASHLPCLRIEFLSLC